MTNVLDLYYNHPKKSSTYEVDHLDWNKAVLANDKRKLRNILRNVGVVGKIEEVVK